MAGADLALGQQALDAGRKLEQSERVGDRRPALPDPGGHLVVGVAELLDELLIGGRLFEDVEILAVEVLDQRLLEAVGVVRCLDQDRDRLETGPPGGPPPSLAGDQLELVGASPRSASPGRAGGCRAP